MVGLSVWPCCVMSELSSPICFRLFDVGNDPFTQRKVAKVFVQMAPESDIFIEESMSYIMQQNILSRTKNYWHTAESNAGPWKPNFMKQALSL